MHKIANVDITSSNCSALNNCPLLYLIVILYVFILSFFAVTNPNVSFYIAQFNYYYYVDFWSCFIVTSMFSIFTECYKLCILHMYLFNVTLTFINIAHNYMFYIPVNKCK